MSREQQYIDLYKQHADIIKRHAAPNLNARRDEAFERFRQNGFPTAKDEAYLRCPLFGDLDTDYGLNIGQLPMPIDSESLFKCNVSGIKAHTAFMINDRLQFDGTLPQGVVLCSLDRACHIFPDIVARYLGKKTEKSTDGFTAFNEAFAQNGYFLYVPQHTKLELPIQLVNLLHANSDLMTATRNLIVLDEEAEVKIMVCDHTADDVRFFASRLTETFVGKNAQLDYYTLESTHAQTAQLAQLFIDQAAGSHTTINTIGLHNGHTRNHTEIDLNAPDAETWLGGMVAADSQQRTDNFTVIRHLAPHCTSNELFKYILDGESEGAFAGRILVAKDAQHTAAYQTNRNICLTKNARMHAKPQLEIYADDVKCGHGATTGQLDENALFYMRTRGISMDEARMLLLLAFTNDILDHIAVETVRDRLRLMIEQRLRGGESKCKNCTIKQRRNSCGSN